MLSIPIFSLKPISSIYIVGDNYSDTSNGFLNKQNAVSLLDSSLDTDAQYVLPVKYYLAHMQFPFTFIYCNRTMSNGYVWINYYNKVNECPTRNFSTSNAVILNQVRQKVSTQADMFSVIYSYNSKYILADLIKSLKQEKDEKEESKDSKDNSIDIHNNNNTKTDENPIISKNKDNKDTSNKLKDTDLIMFWLGNNDIKFVHESALIEMFAVYKSNLTTMVDKYNLQHLTLIGLVNIVDFSFYHKDMNVYTISPSKFNLNLNLLYEDLKSKYPTLDITYLDPNLLIKELLDLEYYMFPCYLGNELTNFNYESFKIRSEKEELEYVSMFNTYKLQVSTDSRKEYLKTIQDKYANTRCPVMKSSKYLFYDEYNLSSTTHKKLAVWIDKLMDEAYDFSLCGPTKANNYGFSTQICNPLAFDFYKTKDINTYDKALKEWKNNWDMFRKNAKEGEGEGEGDLVHEGDQVQDQVQESKNNKNNKKDNNKFKQLNNYRKIRNLKKTHVKPKKLENILAEI